jgi:IclR family transcriptional regulator, acetate operon repressor
MAKTSVAQLEPTETLANEINGVDGKYIETVTLGTLSGSKVIYLGMVESSHSLRMHATMSSYDPVDTTSLGKAMLAFYPEDTWTAHVPEKLVPRAHRTITTREAL